jgi:hypothetical protein
MVVAAAVFSPAAIAHGEAGWMHGVLDGAVQFFTSLPSLLPVLMVALLARRDGARHIAIQAAALIANLYSQAWQRNASQCARWRAGLPQLRQSILRS